jgi:hypothetical protein
LDVLVSDGIVESVLVKESPSDFLSTSTFTPQHVRRATLHGGRSFGGFLGVAGQVTDGGGGPAGGELEQVHKSHESETYVRVALGLGAPAAPGPFSKLWATGAAKERRDEEQQRRRIDSGGSIDNGGSIDSGGGWSWCSTVDSGGSIDNGGGWSWCQGLGRRQHQPPDISADTTSTGMDEAGTPGTMSFTAPRSLRCSWSWWCSTAAERIA